MEHNILIPCLSRFYLILFIYLILHCFDLFWSHEGLINHGKYILLAQSSSIPSLNGVYFTIRNFFLSIQLVITHVLKDF